jgi:hypothetical protein
MKSSRFPNRVLVVGIILVILGAVLLLWRLGLLPPLGILWPLPILILGLLFLYMGFVLQMRSRHLLVGMFLTLLGAFFLLYNTVLSNTNLAKIWPVFMMIAGVSIVPYGLRQKRYTRISITIPAIAITVLALFFLPFSLGIMPENFTAFVLTWWPVLVVLGGGLLILSYWMGR